MLSPGRPIGGGGGAPAPTGGAIGGGGAPAGGNIGGGGAPADGGTTAGGGATAAGRTAGGGPDRVLVTGIRRPSGTSAPDGKPISVLSPGRPIGRAGGGAPTPGGGGAAAATAGGAAAALGGGAAAATRGTYAGGGGAAAAAGGMGRRLPSGTSFPDGKPLSVLSPRRAGGGPFLVRVLGPWAYAVTAIKRTTKTVIPLISV